MRDTRVRVVAIALLLVVLGVAFVIATEPVPNVGGLARDEAVERLRRLGYRVSIAYSERESSDPWKVKEQDPGPGSITRNGAEVRLLVDGFAPVEVPEVESQTLEEAQARLERVGLKSEVVSHVRTDEVTAGLVVSVAPSAGVEIQRGSTVYVTVAQPLTAKVPNVVGMEVEKAERVIRAAGFKPNLKGRPPLTVALSQSPKAGAKAVLGSAVTVQGKEVIPKQSDVWNAYEGDVIYVRVTRKDATLDTTPEDLLGNSLDFDFWTFRYGGEPYQTDWGTSRSSKLIIYMPRGVPRGSVRYGDLVGMRVDDYITGTRDVSLSCTFIDVWRP